MLMIERALRRPYHLKGEVHYATASIGIAIFPFDGITAEELLRNSDLAMYEQKAALVFLKVDAFWKDVISGSLLILIVVFDMLLIHRNNQKAKKQRLNARVLEIRKEM